MLRLGGLALLMLLCVGASLFVGGVPLSPHTVVAAIIHPHGTAGIIVWQLRFARIAIAATVGAALALAGVLLQGMLRNPLVDAYLTGTSAGAACATAIAIAFGIAAPLLPLFGFVAGLATVMLVAAFARRGSGLDPYRLIIAGISVSALLSSVVTLVVLHEHEGGAQAILAWLAGSIAGRGWSDLAFAAPYAALGTVLAFAAAPMLDALRIGDERARAVGVNVARAQWLVLVASALLAAAAVALAGMVGFVGLIVPHVARRAVGSGAIALLPACAFLGAALTVLADAFARSIIAPSELPLGVVLAFFGVPAFLYLLLHRARGVA